MEFSQSGHDLRLAAWQQGQKYRMTAQQKMEAASPSCPSQVKQVRMDMRLQNSINPYNTLTLTVCIKWCINVPIHAEVMVSSFPVKITEWFPLRMWFSFICLYLTLRLRPLPTVLRTTEQQQRFHDICGNLVKTQRRVVGWWKRLCALKEEKPKMVNENLIKQKIRELGRSSVLISLVNV